MKRHSLITTVVIFILVISTLCMAGIQKGSGGGSASETSYDPSASGLTSTNIQDAIDETVGLIGEANTQGIVWGTLPTLATTTGLGTKYLLWGDDGTSKKMTGENFLDWIATDGGFLGASALSDTSYGPGWDADTTHTATKNAVYDAIAGLSSVYQPLDSDLTIYAGITPSANMQTFLGSADYAAMRTNLSLVPGTNVQAYDADLAALAGISGQRGDILFYGASGWTRLAKGTENYVLTQGANDPAWAAPPGGEGSTADGGEGAIQLSDGAGGFTSNAAFYHSGGILHVPEGGIEVAQSATQAGGWSGKELSGNGTNYIGFEVPDAITADRTYKLTDTAPEANSFMLFGAPSGGYSAQTWGELDDTAGNGDTAKIWSADKTYDELALKLSNSLYDAHTILYATIDNTPAVLSVTEQTLVGRATGGNIAAIAIDADLSSVSGSDDTIPSAKATKTALDSKMDKTTRFTFPVTIKGPTADDDYPIWKAPWNCTVVAVHYLCVGGTSWTGQLQEANANGGAGADTQASDTTAAAGTTSTVTSFSNASIDSGDWVNIKTTSVSGTITSLTVQLEVTIN
jgi:hypothetical protein